MTPLVSPGMPCIIVTLLRTKYSLQEALSALEPPQKSAHSAVPTVWLPTSSVFRHLSKFRFWSVRFPSRHTLQHGGEQRYINVKLWSTLLFL